MKVMIQKVIKKKEYDINWCNDTIEYMSKKKANLQYKKDAITKCINSFLEELYKNNFNENSEKTKNIFNKIKIVWGGFINDFKWLGIDYDQIIWQSKRKDLYHT